MRAREPHHSLMTGDRLGGRDLGNRGGIGDLPALDHDALVFLVEPDGGGPVIGESGSTPISRSAMAAFLTRLCTGLHIPTICRSPPASQRPDADPQNARPALPMLGPTRISVRCPTRS